MPDDSKELRIRMAKDWLRISKNDRDLAEVLDYIDEYELNEEILNISLTKDKASELESLALNIKMYEEGFLVNDKLSHLGAILQIRPILDDVFRDLSYYNSTNRFEVSLNTLNELSVRQLELLVEATVDYQRSREFLAVAQTHLSLDMELREGFDIGNIEDMEDAERGIEFYKKCMDVCDRGFPMLLNLKYASEDEDPGESDFLSMPFGAVRNNLEEHDSFKPIVDGIDEDLRNAISHGDIWTDPVENTIETNNPNKSYSFDELADTLSTTYPVARFVGALPLVIRARYAAEKSGFSEYARNRLPDRSDKTE